MAFSSGDDWQVMDTEELTAWLGRLPAGTALFLERQDGTSLPVLMTAHNKPPSVGKAALGEAFAALARGEECRLVARVQEEEGQASEPAPVRPLDSTEDDNRRLVFRAELALSMRVDVLLRIGEGLQTRQIQARLHNLSIGGCLVELPLKAEEILPDDESMVAVSLCFPDATQFTIDAWLSHRTPDKGHRALLAGLRFHTQSAEQDRKLWYFVREVEREAARVAGQSRRMPSSLFEIS